MGRGQTGQCDIMPQAHFVSEFIIACSQKGKNTCLIFSNYLAEGNCQFTFNTFSTHPSYLAQSNLEAFFYMGRLNTKILKTKHYVNI